MGRVMEDNSSSRFALPAVASTLAAAVVVNSSEYITVIITWLRQQISSIDYNELLKALIDHILLVTIFGVAAFNYKRISIFVQKYIKPTDAQTTGKWYVSRYVKKNGTLEIITEKWLIKRNITRSSYCVTTHEKAIYGWNTSGELIYNERDRFNILLNGSDHKQQSLICFQSNIPRNANSRILGIGVGDDSQYVLSARVYFASRIRLPDEHVQSVIDDATAKLSAPNNNQMFQLPTNVISEVLGRHPIPAAPSAPHTNPYNVAARLYTYLRQLYTQLRQLSP